MIKIAIVEDEEIYSSQLNGYLSRYSADRHLTFDVKVFANAVVFLEGYTADYDLVFLDIKMPYMSGMDAAKHLRTLDETVSIIFMTNLAQYAIEGYSVRAVDYILKPIDYNEFTLKFSRALKHITENERETLLVPTQQGLIRVQIADIRYVESQKHHVIYHLRDTQLTRRCSLGAAEKELNQNFVRCNNCYLVNLAFVQCIKSYSVWVGGEELTISQPRKKKFLQQVENFVR